MRTDDLNDSELDRAIRDLLSPMPRSPAWERAQRDELLTYIEAASGRAVPSPAASTYDVDVSGHGPPRRDRSSWRWFLLGAAAATVVLLGGLAIVRPWSDDASPRPPAQSVPSSIEETVPTEPVVSTQPIENPAASTAPTSTSTVVPVEARPPVAFGESVMLGAKATLEGRGITVIASEANQGQWILDQIRSERAAGRIGRTVIIQTGANGTVEDYFLAAIMTELPPEEVNLVIFLTVKADKSWIVGNNERIRALAGYPNVHVVDWEAMAIERPDLLAADGVHLKNQAAYDFYTDAITAVWSGTPPD